MTVVIYSVHLIILWEIRAALMPVGCDNPVTSDSLHRPCKYVSSVNIWFLAIQCTWNCYTCHIGIVYVLIRYVLSLYPSPRHESCCKFDETHISDRCCPLSDVGRRSAPEDIYPRQAVTVSLTVSFPSFLRSFFCCLAAANPSFPLVSCYPVLKFI